MGLPPTESETDSVGGNPSGLSPLSRGRSRMTQKMIGATISATAEMATTAQRQPELTTIFASRGRKTSCPVA